jgi:hypothetical protein
MKVNLFGGFSPVKYDSSDSFNADDSLKSFQFTLKNPHPGHSVFDNAPGIQDPSLSPNCESLYRNTNRFSQ